MRVALCVLCMAICSGIAGADEQHVSNFEACVSEAKQKRTDLTMENYVSFRCDGAIAERLAARPDQCAADVKPSIRNIERAPRQLSDGVYERIIWRTSVCAGMCEMRRFDDTREAIYMCEVRRHIEGRGPRYGGAPLRDTYYRRSGDDYAPVSPARRWGNYEPTVRSYDPPASYFYRRRRPEPEREPRVTERWYYITPGWHLEYRYPTDYPDDDRAGGYPRGDGYRHEEYRPPRFEYYRDSGYRIGDGRPDEYDRREVAR